MTARRRDAAKVGTFARRVVAWKRGPSGDLTAKTHTRPVATRGWPVPRSHPHEWGPCSTLHRPQHSSRRTWRNPIICRLFRGTGRFGPTTASAPPCVGRLHGVLAHLRARGGRSRFHRACPMDATPERDAAPGRHVLICAYTVTSPRGPCSAFRRKAQIAPVAHAGLDQCFPSFCPTTQ